MAAAVNDTIAWQSQQRSNRLLARSTAFFVGFEEMRKKDIAVSVLSVSSEIHLPPL